MDIDNIEQSLNNFETEPNKVLATLLKQAVINEALLQTMLDLQISSIALKLPEPEKSQFVTHAYEQLQVTLVEIQARISNQL